jgi:hypothetical protein
MNMKRAFCVLGLIIAVILVCRPTGAGEVGPTFPISGTDFHIPRNLSDDHSGADSLFPSIGLRIPLPGSLSLDLSLSSVNTGQAPADEKQLYAPPIPLPKASEFDLRYSRIGAGFSFRF